MRVVIATVIFLLVSVLAVSLISKVRSRAGFDGFADAVAGLRVVPSGWAAAVATVGVGAEVLVLALLIWPGGALVGLAAATMLFGAFTGALATALRRGAQVGCHCFGATSAPVARRHVARSGFLCAVSFAALCSALTTSAQPLRGIEAPYLMVALTGAAIVAAALVWLDDLVWLLRPTARIP